MDYPGNDNKIMYTHSSHIRAMNYSKYVVSERTHGNQWLHSQHFVFLNDVVYLVDRMDIRMLRKYNMPSCISHVHVYSSYLAHVGEEDGVNSIESVAVEG